MFVCFPFAVTLGTTVAKQTVFYHSEDNRRDFVQTDDIDPKLKVRLYRYLVALNLHLRGQPYWAMLIGEMINISDYNVNHLTVQFAIEPWNHRICEFFKAHEHESTDFRALKLGHFRSGA